MDLPFDLHLQDPTFEKILITAVILLLALGLAKVSQRLAARYVDDLERRYRASKLARRVIALLTLLLVVGLWLPNLGSLFTLLTVVGAGLAIATREVLLSFVGWMDVALRSPFEQGDRIEINGLRGDVVDIRLLHSTLMEIGGWVGADQSSGRLVHFPNSWVFQYPIYNYTHGFNFIWNEMSVTVTFRSDWEAAREIMAELAQESADIIEQQAVQQLRRLSREYLVHYSILTPFVYIRIVDSGVQLTLRYLCEVRKRRGTEHAFAQQILRRFAEHDRIELAYPMTGAKVFDTPQFGPDAGPNFRGLRGGKGPRDARSGNPDAPPRPGP